VSGNCYRISAAELWIFSTALSTPFKHFRIPMFVVRKAAADGSHRNND